MTRRISILALAAIAVAFSATIAPGADASPASREDKPTSSTTAPEADASFTYRETPRFLLRAPQPDRTDLRFYGELCENALDLLSPGFDPTRSGRGPIDVRVSPDERDFARETGMNAARTLAVAFPGRGYIVLNAPALSRADPAERFGVVGHELVHLLLGRVGGGRAKVPLWLHEGLAQLLSGEGESTGDAIRLAWAGLLGRRIAIKDLTDTFPYGESSAALAYTESASFTRHVATEGLFFESPREFFEYLLSNSRQARETLTDLNDQATLAQLEAAWRSHSKMSGRIVLILTSSGAIWGAIVVLFLIAYVRKRRREKRVIEDWDAWER
ncbi:hypothetical protein JW916_07875 [Candidatus Sumerlaeota bacterium]|nr:hypothetical protein [Candidatus Sumerlaeota bacterium]